MHALRSDSRPPPAASLLVPSDARAVAATLATLAVLLLWDASGGDLWAAHWFGGAGGFAARDNWWLNAVMHRGGKTLCWLAMVAIALGVRWPLGPLRRLSRAERWQLLTSALAGVAAVAVMKHASHTSCPWDVQGFGGVRPYVSHWALGVWDGGPGHCFPAGHASAGFAFVGGWFALRRAAPRAAIAWLAASLALGLAFGLAQQARGAHFLSHTLWSAWVCWCAGWAVELAGRAWRARRSPSAGEVLAGA